MKQVLIFLTTILSALISLANPDYNFIHNKEIKWQDLETEVSLELKMEYLQKIAKYDTEEYFLNDYGYTNDPTSFAVIDFDGDGIKDIIYYGWLSSEAKFSIFFKNDGNDFEYIALIVGEIIDIYGNPNSPLSFRVHEKFGCCFHMKYFITYTPVFSSNKFNFQISEILGYGYFNKKPKTLYNKSIQFRIKNQVYKLRYSPTIDDKTVLEYTPVKEMKGNVIAEYTTGDIGYGIADYTDATGRVWWYVIMDYKQNVKNNILEPRPRTKNEAFYSVGWMSSRYLEELN